MKAMKVSGNVSNGVINTSLGKPNAKPSPRDTSGMTLKNKGARSLSTRLPYNSSRGEIKNHHGI